MVPHDSSSVQCLDYKLSNNVSAYIGEDIDSAYWRIVYCTHAAAWSQGNLQHITTYMLALDHWIIAILAYSINLRKSRKSYSTIVIKLNYY